MRHITILLAVAIALSAGPVRANLIVDACLQSNRTAASRAVCSCIGSVAEQTLTRGQIRQGARFFSDPQRAQDTRQSDRRSDRALWQAWRRFGEAAEARCTAGG